MAEVLKRAEWLLALYDNNSGGLLSIYQGIVEGNLPHIEGLIQLSKGDSDTDKKTREVIAKLLIRINESKPHKTGVVELLRKVSLKLN